MPSKGVQVYAYIAVPGCQVEFVIPGRTLTISQPQTFTNNRLEIDKKNLSGPFNFVGQFKFNVTSNGSLITSQWVTVNVLTGNLERGTMKSMVDQVSFVSDQIVVTHLFYDAGTGQAGLPNSHQCLVTVTPNYSNWMGQVAIPGSNKATKPFSRFYLPSAHDVGMNSMQTSDAAIQGAGGVFVGILKKSDEIFATVFQAIGLDKLAQGIAQGMAPNIISGLAITQKDRLKVLFAVGARYFEFRPARLHSMLRATNAVPDKLYFQHGPIPGMAYDQFLFEVVNFLLTHPTEIIVFQVRWDGVPAECERPSDQELEDLVTDALKPSDGALKVGTLEEMNTLSVDELRAQRKRLIICKNVDSLSSYDDKANATLQGDSIVAAFEQLNADRQSGKAFTNLQCQATATNLKDVVIYSAITANVSNSCLLATKAVCDNKTLPWIRQNALDRLKGEQLVVIMNDFLDGATVDVAVELSKARFES